MFYFLCALVLLSTSVTSLASAHAPANPTEHIPTRLELSGQKLATIISHLNNESLGGYEIESIQLAPLRGAAWESAVVHLKAGAESITVDLLVKSVCSKTECYYSVNANNVAKPF